MSDEAWKNPVTIFELEDPDDMPLYPAWKITGPGSFEINPAGDRQR